MHISNIRFHEYNADELILKLMNEVSISIGSACASEVIEPSHVLLALGLSYEKCKQSIRFSFGRGYI